MAVVGASEIEIPAGLLPSDGRFGSGPSKVPIAALEALAGSSVIGTSHRADPVRSLVGKIRSGLSELFELPHGFEVALGNGGSVAFWDIATFCLVEQHSQHLSFGEFSARFATAALRAPHLSSPEIIEGVAGSCPRPSPGPGIDAYALTHNETSTGVMADLRLPEGADASSIVVVDATSAAGAIVFDPANVDAYYFAPQKCFASDGGLWLCLLSPAAIDRVSRIAASKRWVPASLDLAEALAQSRRDQTVNTPALATLVLLAHQLEWLLDGGGMDFAAKRCRQSSSTIYRWAEDSEYARPFVPLPADRSTVVATVDLDESISAPLVCEVLRANGIVDTEPYRKLGRNQLRVAMYPAVDPSDVEALTKCIDHVVAALH